MGECGSKLETDTGRVVALRAQGLSRSRIVKATGLPERFVRGVIEKCPTPVKINRESTNKSRSVTRCIEIMKKVGYIKDYQLRDILHEEYGTYWCTDSGRYRTNITPDIVKSVKASVRKINKAYVFVPDWMNVEMADSCYVDLQSFAEDLKSRIEEYSHSYMYQYIDNLDGEDIKEDARKALMQRRSVIALLSKLVFPENHRIPLSSLFSNINNTILELKGEGLYVDTLDSDYFFKSEKPYYPEPSDEGDAFLDYAEELVSDLQFNKEVNSFDVDVSKAGY